MKKETVPCEWIYFAPEHTTVNTLADCAKAHGAEVELWGEAGVLEILLQEKESMDVELAKLSPKDELACAVAEKENCPVLFLITYCEGVQEVAQQMMRHMLKENGGIFCADTENLEPVIKR